MSVKFSSRNGLSGSSGKVVPPSAPYVPSIRTDDLDAASEYTNSPNSSSARVPYTPVGAYNPAVIKATSRDTDKTSLPTPPAPSRRVPRADSTQTFIRNMEKLVERGYDSRSASKALIDNHYDVDRAASALANQEAGRMQTDNSHNTVGRDSSHNSIKESCSTSHSTVHSYRTQSQTRSAREADKLLSDAVGVGAQIDSRSNMVSPVATPVTSPTFGYVDTGFNTETGSTNETVRGSSSVYEPGTKSKEGKSKKNSISSVLRSVGITMGRKTLSGDNDASNSTSDPRASRDSGGSSTASTTASMPTTNITARTGTLSQPAYIPHAIPIND